MVLFTVTIQGTIVLKKYLKIYKGKFKETVTQF